MESDRPNVIIVEYVSLRGSPKKRSSFRRERDFRMRYDETVTERETENAKKLLTGSRVFATNSREGFVAHYPTLNQFSSDRWDSRTAVAGTGTALLMIPGRFEALEQKQLTATVLETVRDWDASAVQTLAEFINYVTTEAKDSTRIPDVIGTWVLEEVKLSASEHSAPQVLGLMLMNTFGPWWDQ